MAPSTFLVSPYPPLRRLGYTAGELEPQVGAHLFFGDFLVGEGLVDKEALSVALERQASGFRRLGELAIQQGFLNDDQVRQVHLCQQADDRLFGEIAEAMGFLDERQVEQLRLQQQQSHVRIGEALVEIGALTVEELSDSLREYAVQQQHAARSVERTIADSAHPRVLSTLVGATRMMLPRCGLRGCKVTEVRIVPHAADGVDWTAFTNIDGRFRIAFGIGVSSDALACISTSMGHRWVPGEGSRAVVYLGEFLRFVAERAQADLGDEMDVGEVETAPGDGYLWIEELMAERHFTQVELALAVPGQPTTMGLLTVATVR